MARDLLVYGIMQDELIKALTINADTWLVPQKKLNEFVTRFKNRIHISDKIALENFLFEKSELTIEEQHIELRINEIISYRSKKVCFVISNLVCNYIKNIKIDSCEGCFIISKHQITDMLEWIINIAGIDDVENIAIQKYSLDRLEFKLFKEQKSMIIDWKEKIEKSYYDFYYWEDSY